MDLTAALSDDQIAIMGCFAALTVCGLIAAITFQFGSAGRHSQVAKQNSVPFSPPKQNDESDQKRRAA